jgi:uncharacterized protein (DUF2267 family)
MSESLKNVAASTGFDSGTIEKVLGGVLSFLKAHVSPETYAAIEAKLPEAERTVARFAEAAASGPDGLLGKVSELAGKLLGGDSGGDLLGKLARLGLPAGDLAAILPKLFQFLADRLPPDLLKRIAEALPAIPGVDKSALLDEPGMESDTLEYPAPTIDMPGSTG